MTGTGRTGAGEARLPPGRMTEAEFRSLYEQLRNQRPWGPTTGEGR